MNMTTSAWGLSQPMMSSEKWHGSADERWEGTKSVFPVGTLTGETGWSPMAYAMAKWSRNTVRYMTTVHVHMHVATQTSISHTVAGEQIERRVENVKLVRVDAKIEALQDLFKCRLVHGAGAAVVDAKKHLTTGSRYNCAFAATHVDALLSSRDSSLQPLV